MGIIKVGRVEADVSRTITPAEREKLIGKIVDRFPAFPHRHTDIKIHAVVDHLRHAAFKSLWSLDVLERAGAEPDVTGYNPETGRYRFDTMSRKAPSGFANCVFDKKAEKALFDMYGRSDNEKPWWNSNAVQIVGELGAKLWTEEYLLEREALENAQDERASSMLKVYRSMHRSIPNWHWRLPWYYFEHQRTWLKKPKDFRPLVSYEDAYMSNENGQHAFPIAGDVHDESWSVRSTLWV